jgi:hypothetical protein
MTGLEWMVVIIVFLLCTKVRFSWHGGSKKKEAGVSDEYVDSPPL